MPENVTPVEALLLIDLQVGSLAAVPDAERLVDRTAVLLAAARAASSLGYRVVLPRDAHATTNIPATPGLSDLIPAATVSRVAEWALSDQIELVHAARSVPFTKPPR